MKLTQNTVEKNTEIRRNFPIITNRFGDFSLEKTKRKNI